MSRVPTPLDSLQKLIAPPSKATECGPLTQRKSVERALGLPLPSDLYEFARLYGGGAFGTREFNYLVEIWNPFSAVFVKWVTEFAETFRDVKTAEGESYIPFDIYPERPGLLTFGCGDNRQYLFWLTEGEPDDWPILLWPPERRFLRFDMRLSEFLYRLFSGKIDGWGGTQDAKWFKAHRQKTRFTPSPAVK